MLGYTRRQVVMLVVIAAVGAAGLGVDRWRHANPDVVEYLEALDRAPAAPPPDMMARRAPARTPQSPPSNVTAPAGVAAGIAGHRERARPRRERAIDAAAPIDVNLASAADLERLPGVGAALAARIIDTRARDGPFASVDDLRRVRGVGDATLERLRPRLAVTSP